MSNHWKKTHEFHEARYERQPDKKPRGTSIDDILEIGVVIILIILFIALVYWLALGIWFIIKWVTIVITAPWWFPLAQGSNNLDIIYNAGYNTFTDILAIIFIIVGLTAAIIASFFTNKFLKGKKKKKIIIYPLNITVLTLSFCWTFLILSYLSLLIFHIIN